VFISGTLFITGSLQAPSITGSLLGTSSWALSASYVNLLAGPNITINYQPNGIAISGSGGSGSPGGPTNSIQFNNAGAFSGSSNFTFDGVSNTVMLQGSAQITGSLWVSGGGITGSLLGTSSWAVSSSRAITASFALTSSLAVSSSYASSSLSASYAATASFYNDIGLIITCSQVDTIGNPSNTTLISVTGTTMSLSQGVWQIVYRGTYHVPATTVGALFTLSASVAPNLVAGIVTYTAGIGDDGSSLFGVMGGGLPVVSSRVTTNNGLNVQAIVHTTASLPIHLVFRSEVNNSAVTASSITGIAVKVG